MNSDNSSDNCPPDNSPLIIHLLQTIHLQTIHLLLGVCVGATDCDCKVLSRPYQGSRCEQGVKQLDFLWELRGYIYFSGSSGFACVGWRCQPTCQPTCQLFCQLLHSHHHHMILCRYITCYARTLHQGTWAVLDCTDPDTEGRPNGHCAITSAGKFCSID